MNTIMLCFLIIVVRIIETSMATVRMIFTIKNKKTISTIIAFFEILIWFLIVKEAINTEGHNIFIAFSYALGFSLGTYIGMVINETRVPSNLFVTIIISKNKLKILRTLTENKFAYSALKIEGKNLKKRKNILFIVTTNKKVNKLEQIVLEYDEKAFIVTNEPKQIFNGFF